MTQETTRTRFEGIERLYGNIGLQRLSQAHVCVLGLGGVGSWAAEALARSGVGALTLVDLDEACVSNINRQVHALEHTLGRSKVSLMAERIAAINPACHIVAIEDFITPANTAEILKGPFQYVLDAIDSPAPKAAVVAHCFRQQMPLLISGGAGGATNPYQLQITDLNACSHDRLLRHLRRKLRRELGFPKGSKKAWGLSAIYTPHASPQGLQACSTADVADGSGRSGLSCEGALGSACFVTGSMGFYAAAHIVNALVTPAIVSASATPVL